MACAARGVGQLPAQGGRQLRLQARGADANPSLQMAGAGLEHHTWFMTVGPHGFENTGAGLIEIEENIAGIARPAVGEEVHVKTLTVACAQKMHHCSTHQLSGSPQPFSWSWPVCAAVHHTDEVEMVRHPGQLAAAGVQGKKESAVEHGTENEPGSLRLEISFQRMVSSVLTSCLSSGDNPRFTWISHALQRSPATSTGRSRFCTTSGMCVRWSGSMRFQKTSLDAQWLIGE